MQTLSNISPINVDERKNLDIRSGDTVKVTQRIEEKGKVRLQIFEGIVIAKKHGTEPGATFTVRRAKGGYTVEKIFPLYSPMIDKIEIVRRAKTRRSKLYFLREKTAKASRRKLNKAFSLGIATSSFEEEKKAAQAEAKKAEEEKARAEAEAKKAEEEKAKAETQTKTEEEDKVKTESKPDKEEVSVAKEVEQKDEIPEKLNDSKESQE